MSKFSGMVSKSLDTKSGFDPERFLERLGGLDDQEIDLALAALAMATRAHPGISIERYLHHLEKVGREVGLRFSAALKEGDDDCVAARLGALSEVLCDQYGYEGDVETYDDLQNVSLIRVIDRAKGLPVALCILYIHAARAQGWDIEGLNIPGRFLCRLEKDGQRLMFDPFGGCKVIEAHDLRGIVKQALGEKAELASEYYESLCNRDILMHLQNNIKFRQIEVEDYEGGLETVELMRLVDPREYRLFLDAGVLYARTDAPEKAIDSLTRYIEKAPNSSDRMEAELLLREIRDQLN